MTCDTRCWSAKTPRCSCECGGAKHGCAGVQLALPFPFPDGTVANPEVLEAGPEAGLEELEKRSREMSEPVWIGMDSCGCLFSVFAEDGKCAVRYGPFWLDCGDSLVALLETVEQLVSPEGMVGEPATAGINRWKRRQERN